MADAVPPGPLDGVRIVDLTEGISGPYATKLLADFGADVIKVERPGGDLTRRLGPFPNDEPHPERSGTFFYFNTNKRSIELDIKTDEGRETLERLLDGADALVESFRPGVLEKLGFGWDSVHEKWPNVAMASATNFGQTGPYRDYRGTDLTLFGFGGEMYTMGVAEREPVKMYGTAALVESGAAFSAGIMAALTAAKRDGTGQHVDFSIADSQLGGADRRHAYMMGFEFAGKKSMRPSVDARAALQGIYPCADGYIEFTGAAGRLDRFKDMLGHPDWLDDERWLAPGALLQPETSAEFEAHLYGWLMEHTKEQIWAKAREARVLCGPLFSTEELSDDRHFHDRGFWSQAEHAELGTVQIPGRPFILSASLWALRRSAPHLNEHEAEIRDELAAQGARQSASAAAVPARQRLPLEGLRVLDLCVVWAGTFSTVLLADLGAEVIKVENPHVMQPMTRGLAHPPQHLLDGPGARGGYPNGEFGPRPWNYCPTFVQLYRNKKSFSVDLRRPEGMDVLRRLIAESDVIIENNATETMEKLGVTYDFAKQANENIIMMRIPAYGSTGPYDQARALGVHLESVMGHTLLRGYRELDPSANAAIFSGDYLAGAQAALATMLAVWHREKTGEGQLIEMGQAETASAMLAQAYMDLALNGRVHERNGNRSMYGLAPHGVFPCMSPGSVEEAEDHWISIAVNTDEEWEGLKRAMGNPAWASDPSYATASGRVAAQDDIERQLAEWTQGFDDYELFHKLQAEGVPAAPVLEASRTFDDPQFIHRGMLQKAALYDGVGEFRFVSPFFRFSDTTIDIRRAAVAMGQDNDYVYRELLKVSAEEYDRLEAAGHISMEFDANLA